MNQYLLLAAVFASAAFAFAAAASLFYDVFLRRSDEIKRRLAEEFHEGVGDGSKPSPLFKGLKDLAEDGSPRPGLRTRIDLLIEQSGLAITPDRLLAISGGVGLCAASLSMLLRPEIWVASIAFVATASIPFACVVLLRKRRIELLRSQLPEAFELMSRAVRAGQTIPAAFEVVARDGSVPLATEFAFCREQQSLGLSPERALRDLARRAGVMEMRMFVVTMLVQRQCGGNPVEVLNNLADVMRKRTRMAAKVKALTGEGRMQAVVLLILPPVLLAAMYVLNPAYTSVLFERPELLAGMAVSEFLGALCIRKIVNFDV